MLFAFMPGVGSVTAFAESKTANIGSASGLTAEAGSTVTVPVNISDYSGIAGIGLTVTYNDAILTPLAVETTAMTEDGVIDDSIEVSKDNSFKIVWSQGQSENITGEGTLFNLKFKVADYVEEETSIEFDGVKADTFDADFNTVILNCSPAVVSVIPKQAAGPTIRSDSNQSFNDDSEISIPITLDNPEGIRALSFKMSYDADFFAYDSVEAGIASAEGISVNAANGEADITVSDIPEDAASGTLLKMKFKTAKYASGDYIFKLTSDDVNAINFKVSVVNTHAEESTFLRGGETQLSGDQLRVPVNITNNPGIAGFRITMSYDADVLTPVSVEKDSRLKGNFNHSIGDKSGTFDLLWTGVDNMMGEGTLFTVTFTVNKAEDTVIGLSYTQGDTCNEDLEDVVLVPQDINVSLKEPAKIDLAECGAEISGIGNMTYTASLKNAPEYFAGKVIVTVGSETLVLNQDYEVSTKESINVGPAVITVKGIGKYTGELTETIKVNPIGVKISKVVAAKKGFTVKWKKQSKKMGASVITGYQIRYSLKSNMKKSKTVTVKGYKKTSKTIKKLKAKKKYYIQIRTYKIVNGNKYCSKWSKNRSIKTK